MLTVNTSPQCIALEQLRSTGWPSDPCLPPWLRKSCGSPKQGHPARSMAPARVKQQMSSDWNPLFCPRCRDVRVTIKTHPGTEKGLVIVVLNMDLLDDCNWWSIFLGQPMSTPLVFCGKKKQKQMWMELRTYTLHGSSHWNPQNPPNLVLCKYIFHLTSRFDKSFVGADGLTLWEAGTVSSAWHV